MAGASATFVAPLFRHSGFLLNITSLAALQQARRRSLASLGVRVISDERLYGSHWLHKLTKYAILEVGLPYIQPPTPNAQIFLCNEVKRWETKQHVEK